MKRLTRHQLISLLPKVKDIPGALEQVLAPGLAHHY
jgi:hypothetical protein